MQQIIRQLIRDRFCDRSAIHQHFKLFPLEKDIDRFLDVYEPETDGEKIYQQAVRDGQIIEEFDSEIINEEVYDENNNQN